MGEMSKASAPGMARLELTEVLAALYNLPIITAIDTLSSNSQFLKEAFLHDGDSTSCCRNLLSDAVDITTTKQNFPCRNATDQIIRKHLL